MDVVIIDYGAGNTQSVKIALNRLGCNSILSSDKDKILKSDRVIFPGVGEASSAMKKLKSIQLHRLIPDLKQPVLGICLGMQLMCDYSEEGDTECLGIFKASVKRFDNKLKTPQVGWNTISSLKTSLFNGVKENEYMYLLHSYRGALRANLYVHEEIHTAEAAAKAAAHPAAPAAPSVAAPAAAPAAAAAAAAAASVSE